jgi:hypothetical protein
MAIYGAFDMKTGLVDPATIHGHQRGAMVNWLYNRGYPVDSNWTYELIRNTFMANAHLVRLAELEIEVLRMPVPDPEFHE